LVLEFLVESKSNFGFLVDGGRRSFSLNSTLTALSISKSLLPGLDFQGIVIIEIC